MTHAQAEGLYDRYFRGELERAETRELHAHFKDCELCHSRIRLRRAAAPAGGGADQGLSSPETQRQIARNRDLLIKILFLGVAAWAVFHWTK